jgi:hypothetical protein
LRPARARHNEQKDSNNVNIKLAAATLGAAIMIAGAPAFASAADMQTGPIHIESLQFSGGSLSNSDDDSIVVPGFAAIAFTNEYASPATDVVFALSNNGYVIDRFNDAGTFTPGVTIKHQFAENQPGDDIRVAVEEATFADGTVWHNPDVVPAPQPLPEVGVQANQF